MKMQETNQDEPTSESALQILKELTNPNPPARKMPAQVFAELQKQLDEDALKEHYIKLEERLQTDYALAEQVFVRLRREAKKEKERADRAELKLKTLSIINRIACPVLFVLLVIEIVRFGI